MSTQDLFKAGVEAYQSGDLAQADTILSKAVFEDPGNGSAWLWLGRSLTNPEQKRYCFHQAVMLGGSNQAARLELENLDHIHVPAISLGPTPETDLSSLILAASTPSAAEQERPPIPQQTVTPVPSKKSMRIPRPILLGSIGALGLVIVVGLAAVFWTALYRPGRSAPASGISLPTPTQAAVISLPTPAQTLPVVMLPPTPSQTPTATSPFPPTWTPASSPGARATSTPTLAPTVNLTRPALAKTLAAVPTTTPKKTNPDIAKKFQQDLQKCNQLLRSSVDDAHAYFQRAVCYGSLRERLGVGDDYASVVNSGLKEIDHAITLSPKEADFYTLRALFYDALQKEYPFRVDSDQIYQIELDNYRFASQLTPGDVDIAQNTAWILINLGRCQEAFQIASQLLVQHPDLSGLSSNFDELMAESYACQGQYPKASEYADLGIKAGNACACEWEKGYYLYLTGQAEAAKSYLLDAASYNDDRFYLVGIIDADQGNIEDARLDLQLGERMTYDRHGLHAYLAGKIALADGDRYGALSNFRDAEATLPHRKDQLLAMVRTELTKLGTVPQAVMKSFTIRTTPLPSLTPWTPTPTQTPMP
jgi:tetratricopeptide (TPR) repeat protein